MAISFLGVPVGRPQQDKGKRLLSWGVLFDNGNSQLVRQAAGRDIVSVLPESASATANFSVCLFAHNSSCYRSREDR